MKVSHVENMDTHAVIGGQDVQAFGMSDSAEFFTILSDTLYSDKILAVSREIICNGWDSHIVANIEDKPMDITVSMDKLTIRDYGTGIPHEDIRAIYCVYGDSTKTKSDKETGGFGLGSKAPFAYTDHFTVTNWHDGVRTVYAISRGSVETGGKPDIRTVVSVPDDKGRGIEVSMPIKNENDYLRFSRVIKNVVFYGGINATFNGEAIETLDYSLFDNGFVFTEKTSHLNVEGNIFIKYGSVVYPIQKADEYISEYEEISKIFNEGEFRYNRSNKMVIFSAPPNTIAVTPSREGLSQTEQTRDTIARILKRFCDKLKSLDSNSLQSLVKLSCDHAIAEQKFHNLFFHLANDTINKEVPAIKQILESEIHTYEDLAKYCILKGVNNNLRETELYSCASKYVAYLLKHEPKYKKIYRSLDKYLKLNTRNFHMTDRLNAIITRHMIFEVSKILGDDRDMIRITQRSTSKNHKMRTVSVLDKLPLINVDDILLASSEYAVTEHIGFTYTSRLVIRPGATKKARERVIETLNKSSLKYTDVLHIVEERIDYGVISDTEPKKPKPKGFMYLKNCLNEYGNYSVNSLDDEEHERLEEPKYVVFNRSDDGNHIIDGWGNTSFRTLLELYPDTVVLRNKTSYDSQISKGAINSIDDLFKTMVKYIKDNPKFLNKLDLTRFSNNSYYSKDLTNYRKLFKHIPNLRKKMGIMLLKSSKDKQMAKLFYSMYNSKSSRSLSYEHTDLMKEHFNAVEKLREDSKKISDVLSLKVFNTIDLRDALSAIESGSETEKAVMIKLLNLALKE